MNIFKISISIALISAIVTGIGIFSCVVLMAITNTIIEPPRWLLIPFGGMVLGLCGILLSAIKMLWCEIDE